VQPGDSMWSIAASVLTRHLAATPKVGDIARYWLALIAANAPDLPVPGDPDLLYPGDTVRLPPPPG
jgi:nucleoid-associated protein YgaU